MAGIPGFGGPFRRPLLNVPVHSIIILYRTSSESSGKLQQSLTIVIGGAASGKSSMAERIVRHFVQHAAVPPVYVATAQSCDDEMRRKVAAHRRSRGPDWTTLEAPLDVGEALTGAPPDAAVLIDCATLWLTNHLLAGHDLAAETDRLLAQLGAAPCPVVVVTNEVGMGIVPGDALSRRFREAQGRLNRMLAARAGTVVGAVAGLPLALKGPLPEGAA